MFRSDVRKESFQVDGRVSIKLEYELAIRLGEFLLNSKTEDKQFLALGHHLLNLEENDENDRKNYYSEKRVIRSTSKIINDAKKFDYEPSVFTKREPNY